MITVLFSSAGRRVGLIECFREDAKQIGTEFRAIAVDLNPDMSAACAVSDASYQVPRCTDSAFVPELLRICESNSVDLLIPTIDTELEVFAQNKEKFGKQGTRVMVSSRETIRMCRNKLDTFNHCKNHRISTPQTWPMEEASIRADCLKWPAVAKPVAGSGSIGFRILQNLQEFRTFSAPHREYVVQEYWPGREYTINLFFNSPGKLGCAVPHFRYETRGGEVSKAVTSKCDLLMHFAEKLAGTLPEAEGALCVQVMVGPANEVGLIEINARFGGGYPIAHRAGARFPLWLMQSHLGLKQSVGNDWADGLTMLRYDAAVFLQK